MYNTLNTILNENQTITNYINVLRNAISNEDTIIYVFDIKTKDKIKQQIIQIAIYQLLDQLNTQQSIYILTDKAYQYNINIHQLNDNSTIKYIPHTKPNDMLLYKQIAIPTELKNKLFDEIPNGSCIIVDDVNRFITHYTSENSNIIHRKKNDLITKLISEYRLKNNKYILIDNDYFDMLDAQQKDRVKKIEIDISLDSDSDTYTLTLYMDNTEYNISIKHQDVDTDDILLNMQMDTHSISDLVPLRTNVKLFDTEIAKHSLKWGNILPVSLKPNGVPSRDKTKISLRLAVVKTNYDLPILFIAPLDRRNAILKEFKLLSNTKVPIDNKALSRLKIRSVDDYVKEYDDTSNLLPFIKKSIQDFAQSLKGMPFITLIDLYDKEIFDIDVDYNAIKMYAMSYNTFTIVAFMDKNNRYNIQQHRIEPKLCIRFYQSSANALQ